MIKSKKLALTSYCVTVLAYVSFAKTAHHGVLFSILLASVAIALWAMWLELNGE